MSKQERRGQAAGRPVRLRALAAQKNEITEYYIYRRMARKVRNGHNREVLERLCRAEGRHYKLWQSITGQEVKPNWLRVWLYAMVARLLGLSFGLRLMEKGEVLAQEIYNDLKGYYPQVAEIVKDEQKHEEELIGMINEKLLSYVGSIVLGLNDALVELTGALAGLTLALSDTRLIAMVGSITGIAASLSMGASEYLSNMEDKREGAWQAGLITGITYLITVLILIMPYLLLKNSLAALGTVLIVTIIIIAGFTFYTSVAKKVSFGKRFLRMTLISLGVAVINFVVAVGIKKYFGVDA